MEFTYKDHLKVFREVAEALAYSHMNHERRAKQLERLAAMIYGERERYAECDYRNTLDALLAIILYMDKAGLTHSDVKITLHLFVSVAQNAISRPESIFSLRARKAESSFWLNDEPPLTDASDFTEMSE